MGRVKKLKNCLLKATKPNIKWGWLNDWPLHWPFVPDVKKVFKPTGNSGQTEIQWTDSQTTENQSFLEAHHLRIHLRVKQSRRRNLWFQNNEPGANIKTLPSSNLPAWPACRYRICRPFCRFLDPEISPFWRFLDPETNPFLQFMDPEICISVHFLCLNSGNNI